MILDLVYEVEGKIFGPRVTSARFQLVPRLFEASREIGKKNLDSTRGSQK
jgi:hypothetical protein